MQSLKPAARQIALWRHDPVQFVRDLFDIEPDEWQKDFLWGYLKNRRIASKACKGPGKTCVLAWCCWHFLVCYYQAEIAATSITGDNLRDGLWKEMSKWQQKSPFLLSAFTWKAERIESNDHKETWWMSARKWSKSASAEQQANTLAGLHAENIMFVLDESGGIPDAVMAAAEAVLANEGGCKKILQCGNPTHLSGPLYRACTKERSMWHVIEITGDPDDPKRSPRISVQWAREQIQKYGRDNPWVLVNVFGKFPPASMNAVIGPDEVRAAMNRIVHQDSYSGFAKILGVDVALQGDDRTIIFPRQGPVAFRPKILRTPKPREIASTVAHAWEKWGADACFIDNTGGWGSGVISHLEEWGYDPIGVQFASKASDPQYKNKRSEIIWDLANWIRNQGCLPYDEEFVEEATALTYFHNKDQLQIVEKDLIKEELGRSPDLYDGLALTFSYPVRKKTEAERMGLGRKDTGNYDPIKREFGGERMRGRDDRDYNPLNNGL